MRHHARIPQHAYHTLDLRDERAQLLYSREHCRDAVPRVVSTLAGASIRVRLARRSSRQMRDELRAGEVLRQRRLRRHAVVVNISERIVHMMNSSERLLHLHRDARPRRTAIQTIPRRSSADASHEGHVRRRISVRLQVPP